MRRAAIGLAVVLCAGCETIPERSIRNSVGPAPNVPWNPPASARLPVGPAAPAPPEIPAEYLKPGTTLSLGQLVDVALRNNPSTREAWHTARAAAAEVGSKRSLYFPYIEVDGSILRQKQAAVGGQFKFLQTTYGPSVAASWLLFNFGGREADVQEATRALYASGWAYNAAIQSVVLRVAEAYYQYLNAKAQVLARQANLEEARKNFEAARERHRAGIATIADELQAQTVVSQVQLNLQEAQGQVQIIRGALATAVGVSANVPVDVGDLPEQLPLDEVQASVDDLIAKARAERPDLASERFRALAAESHIRAAAIDGLPSLKLDASGNRTFYWRPGVADPFSTNYAGVITLRVPIFRGFDTVYQVRKAREEADAAHATAERIEDEIVLDVWSSYYGLQTSTQRVRTTRDLLASAAQSAEVAQGRYKAGVGSILDLLTAQSALADARSQEAQARSLWFLSVAQLAHATGVLQPGSPEIRALPSGVTSDAAPAPGAPPAKGNP